MREMEKEKKIEKKIEKKVIWEKAIDYRELEENICDTIKEWQMKIGYRKEKMQLYYKDNSLCSLLNIDLSLTGAALLQVLSGFSEYSASRLGECCFSYQGSRFCVEVPEQGTLYVKENKPDSMFLRAFIDAVTKKGVTPEEIKNIFASYSKDFVFEDRRGEELGYVFFFRDDAIDKYVYCIEWDEFGTTYHRFTKKDYENLVA